MIEDMFRARTSELALAEEQIKYRMQLAGFARVEKLERALKVARTHLVSAVPSFAMRAH
ncbi:MAG: hypothetical protein ACRDG3_05100 [Tepidiformaceae bacterium]